MEDSSKALAIEIKKAGLSVRLDVDKTPYFVMPVKTGIQCLSKNPIKSLDSRFRGNDGFSINLLQSPLRGWSPCR